MALSTQTISQVQVSRPRQLPFWLALIPICLIPPSLLLANQQESDRSTPPASTIRVEGALVIAGGAIGKQSEIFAEFMGFAGGADSQIVVIPRPVIAQKAGIPLAPSRPGRIEVQQWLPSCTRATAKRRIAMRSSRR